MREKLIELLSEHCAFKEKGCVGCDTDGKYYHPECRINLFGKIAAHLIANGVTIPVRCKDCNWYTERENVSYKGHFCARMTEFVHPDDFCSYGERRTDD